MGARRTSPIEDYFCDWSWRRTKDRGAAQTMLQYCLERGRDSEQPSATTTMSYYGKYGASSAKPCSL
jgi:hypothetical protein